MAAALFRSRGRSPPSRSPGPCREKLEAAATVGFNGIELFENDLLTFDGTPAEVRRIGRELGLTIVAFQPFRDFEPMPEPERARNLERAERKIRHHAGARHRSDARLQQCSPRGDRQNPCRARRAARSARRLRSLAWGRHVNRWSQAWQIVRDANQPALGLVLDSFHSLALKDDFAGIAALPAEKLFSFNAPTRR